MIQDFNCLMPNFGHPHPHPHYPIGCDLEDSKYLIKRVLFSETEPVGTPGVLWVHTDPVSRCTVYFLWENNKWYNLFDKSSGEDVDAIHTIAVNGNSFNANNHIATLPFRKINGNTTLLNNGDNKDLVEILSNFFYLKNDVPSSSTNVEWNQISNFGDDIDLVKIGNLVVNGTNFPVSSPLWNKNAISKWIDKKVTELENKIGYIVGSDGNKIPIVNGGNPIYINSGSGSETGGGSTDTGFKVWFEGEAASYIYENKDNIITAIPYNENYEYVADVKTSPEKTQYSITWPDEFNDYIIYTPASRQLSFLHNDTDEDITVNFTVTAITANRVENRATNSNTFYVKLSKRNDAILKAPEFEMAIVGDAITIESGDSLVGNIITNEPGLWNWNIKSLYQNKTSLENLGITFEESKDTEILEDNWFKIINNAVNFPLTDKSLFSIVFRHSENKNLSLTYPIIIKNPSIEIPKLTVKNSITGQAITYHGQNDNILVEVSGTTNSWYFVSYTVDGETYEGKPDWITLGSDTSVSRLIVMNNNETESQQIVSFTLGIVDYPNVTASVNNIRFLPLADDAPAIFVDNITSGEDVPYGSTRIGTVRIVNTLETNWNYTATYNPNVSSAEISKNGNNITIKSGAVPTLDNNPVTLTLTVYLVNNPSIKCIKTLRLLRAPYSNIFTGLGPILNPISSDEQVENVPRYTGLGYVDLSTVPELDTQLNFDTLNEIYPISGPLNTLESIPNDAVGVEIRTTWRKKIKLTLLNTDKKILFGWPMEWYKKFVNSTGEGYYNDFQFCGGDGGIVFNDGLSIVIRGGGLNNWVHIPVYWDGQYTEESDYTSSIKVEYYDDDNVAPENSNEAQLPYFTESCSIYLKGRNSGIAGGLGWRDYEIAEFIVTPTLISLSKDGNEMTRHLGNLRPDRATILGSPLNTMNVATVSNTLSYNTLENSQQFIILNTDTYNTESSNICSWCRMSSNMNHSYPEDAIFGKKDSEFVLDNLELDFTENTTGEERVCYLHMVIPYEYYINNQNTDMIDKFTDLTGKSITYFDKVVTIVQSGT